MNGKMSSYCHLAIAQLVFGINMVVIKFILPVVPVYINLCLRFFISGLVLSLIFSFNPVSIISGQEAGLKITKREWWFIGLLAVLGGFVFNFLVYNGMQYTTAISAGIIAGATPAFIAVLSIFFLKEALSKAKWLALGFAILGIVVLNMHLSGGSVVPSGAHHLFGDFLILVAVLPEALYTIFAKKLGSRINPLLVAMCTNFICGILFTPLAIHQLLNWNWHNFTPTIAALVVLSALFSCVFYYCWQKGLVSTNASTAAIFTSLMPVGTVLTAVPVLHEHFTLETSAGLLAVLISIVIGAEVLNIKRPRNRFFS